MSCNGFYMNSKRRGFRAYAKYCFSVLMLSAMTLPTVAATAHAGSKPFEELKSDYLLLRNRDPSVAVPDRWRALATRLQSAGSSRRLSDSEGDQALFMAATLYTELTKADGRGERDASRALMLLRDVAGRGGEYADDALARAVELYRALGSKRAASQAAEELRKRFPGSEFTPVVALAGATRGEVASGAESALREVDVVLDPGHGGDDLGAQGYAGLLEKDVTLSISQIAKHALERRGISVALTRKGDDFLPLSTRTKIANQHKARVFVSIHANASVRGTNRGVETYVLDGDQSGNAKLLVQRENGNEASDLAFLLSDVIQREKSPEAKKLAGLLQREVVTKLTAKGFEAADLGVKQAPFFVLVGSHMPSALIEIGYIDNPHEGRLIGSEEYRVAVGEALANGIERFLRGQGRR